MPTFAPIAEQPGWWEKLTSLLSPRAAEAEIVPRDQESQQMVDVMRRGMAPPEGSPSAADPLAAGWFPQQRRDIYKAIADRAQAHPAQVNVSYPTQWKQDPETAAFYSNQYPQAGNIELQRMGRVDTPATETTGPSVQILPRTGNPGATPLATNTLPLQDTLAHELLHFLTRARVEPEAARLPFRTPPGVPMVDAWKQYQQQMGQVPLGTPEKQHALIQYLLGTQEAPTELRPWSFGIPFYDRPPADPRERAAWEESVKYLFPEGHPVRQQALAPFVVPGARARR